MKSIRVIETTIGLALLLMSAAANSAEPEVQAGLAPAPAVASPAPAQVAGEPMVQLKTDQLHSLLEDKLLLDAGRPHHTGDTNMVAILVPFTTFAFLFLMVFVILIFRNRKNRAMHETLRLLVEKGAQIPHELLVPPVRKRSDLRAGVLLISGGLGFGLFMSIIGMFDPNALQGAGVGLVPVFIGIGYLIVWKLNKKNGQSE
jgi:hypothetical protein